MSNTNYAFKAYIKKVLIEVPDYFFFHSSINGKTDKENKFIGRSENYTSFLEILKLGLNKGAYLVTGYRGMGKTSFVDKVTHNYWKDEKEKGERVKIIKYNFGQSKIDDFEILKQINKSIYSGLMDETPIKYFLYLTSLKFISQLLLLLLGFWVFSSLDNYEVSWNFFNFFKSHNPFEYRDGQFKEFIFQVVFYSSITLLTIIDVAIISGFLYRFIKLLKFLNQNKGRISDWLKHFMNFEFINDLFLIRRVINKSEFIYNRCIANVSSESNFSSPAFLGLSFLQKKNISYPKINSKELEQEIIDLLKELTLVKCKLLKIKFIFVFDELDKIEFNSYKGPYYEEIRSQEKIDEAKSKIFDHRERKYAIMNILASLKFFINEAEASFIFIAGREMFDASLADISDRQSSIGSIFNKVIYIDSFLKDQNQDFGSPGLTNMTENFLANKFKFNQEDLKDTNFLTYLYNKIIGQKVNLNFVSNQEFQSIIFLLQNFIIFLSYRSNGSPKKLEKIFESFLIHKNYQKNNNKNLVIHFNDPIIKKDEKITYIKFDYYDQYRIGFNTYLFRPFLLSYSAYFKKYSDSILVSTPFLMDHLLKFHPFAFSIQNIELVPEILSSTKRPELRYFIEDLIFFLSKNHIRETEIGLFDYKFINKTYHEIAFLSKIFEEETAAFNFTFDESYNTKVLLRTKIKELRSIYKDVNIRENEYVHSISFLNTLLGDACYVDEEFDDAITSYSDALQTLKDISNEDMSFKEYMLMIKIRLKLGLTYEKMKSYEIGLGYYQDAISETIRFLNFKLNEKKIKESIDSEKSTLEINKLRKKIDSNYIPFKTGNNSTILPDENNSNIELSTILQFVNQAYLASLYLQQKMNIGGVQLWQIDEAVRNFETLVENIDSKNYLILANFYLNAYQLKYYKNKITERVLENYKVTLYTILSERKTKNLFQLRKLILENNRSLLENYFDLIFKSVNGDTHRGSVTHKNLAHFFSKIGDVYLSKSNDQEEIANFNIFTNIFLNSKEESSLGSNIKKIKEYIHKHKNSPILNYYISSIFYKKSEKHLGQSFQLRKILKLLSVQDLSLIKFENEIDNLKKSVDKILEQILDISSINSNGTDRTQIHKFKRNFGLNYLNHPKDQSKSIYLNTSNSPEVFEALSYVAIIKLKLDRRSRIKIDINNNFGIPDLPELSLVTPVDGVFTQFNRITQLDYQLFVNDFILKKYFNVNLAQIDEYSKFTVLSNNHPIKRDLNYIIKLWDSGLYRKYKIFSVDKYLNGKVGTENEIVLNYINTYVYEFEEIPYLKLIPNLKDFKKIVANSIFCLETIIKTINIFEVSYMLSYSYLASFHMKLGHYLKYYELIRFLEILELKEYYLRKNSNKCLDINQINAILNNKHSGEDKELEEILEGHINQDLDDLLGKSSIQNYDTTSQYQMALKNYNKAKMLHSEGTTFKQHISNMVYLEDDYNDNLYHYLISLERYIISKEDFKKKIEFLEEDVAQSALYKYDSFINSDILD